jgi:hypothetical protein
VVHGLHHILRGGAEGGGDALANRLRYTKPHRPAIRDTVTVWGSADRNSS